MKNTIFYKFFICFCIIFYIVFLNVSSFSFSPANNIILKGVDISSYQNIVDFSKLKKAGYDIVYIKVSEGTSYINPYYEINYKNAKANGFKVGFYHYLSARTTSKAKDEAFFFANSIKGKKADCKLAMDFESFGNLNVSTINNISNVFLETLKKLTNSEVLIYSNTFSARTIFDYSLNKYPLWVAEYGVNSPKPNGKWDTWVGWQFSSRGVVPGISGFVDLNKFTSDIFLKSSDVLPNPNTNNIIYTVKPGDTLSFIALKFNTSINSILVLNPSIKNPNLIYPGQEFLIPNNSTTNNVYIVKPGDTLSNIAKLFNTTVSNLVKINNISNPNLIFPNQKIIINSDNSNLCINVNYKIKFGDNLSRIAIKFNTTISDILMLNKNISNPNLIFAGKTIIVPDCRK